MKHIPWLTPFFMAIRNLRRRFWRSLLTMIGISLGIAVVLAIEMTNQSTLVSLEEVFARAVGKAELLVIPRGDEATLDGDLTAVVQRTPGVQVAAPVVIFQTVLADDTRGVEAQWKSGGVELGRKFEVRGIDLDLDPKIRVYPLIRGRFPEGSRYEILITESYAQDKGLKTGDYLALLTSFGTEELEIAGLLGEDGAGLLNDGAVGFIPLDVAQDIFDLGNQVHEISVQVEPGIGSHPEALEDLKMRLEERLGKAARPTYPVQRGELVPTMLESYQTGLLFFSIIALFTGSFMIYNTFSMSVIERTREIGMVRAIGMSRTQVLALVFSEAGILSMFGAVLGVAFGVLLARGLTYLLGGFISVDESHLELSTGPVLKSIGTGLAITFLAALIPANQAALTSPLEAIRARIQSTRAIHYRVWVSGLGFLFVGWVSFYRLEWRTEVVYAASTVGFILLMLGAVLTIPLAVGALERGTRPIVALLYRKEGAIGSANVRRSILRTTLTLACLMIAMVMIISIGSLSHSFEKDLGNWVNNALGGDLYVRPSETMQVTFSNQLSEIPGVAAVSPSRFFQVKVAQDSRDPGAEQEENLIFTAIEPTAFRQIGDVVFVTGQGQPGKNWERFSQGGSLFISNVLSEEYGLQQGDTLILQTRRGEIPFEVAAITTDFMGNGFAVTGTYADLKRWFSESGADRFTIKLDPTIDIDGVSQEIEKRYRDRYNFDVRSTKTLRESVLRFLDQVFLLFNVLSMIGVVIGGLGVLNTLSMNVFDRTREIGGLRSLGMTRGQVIRMVLAEALAMGLVASIYGMFFGYVMSRVLVVALNVMTSYQIGYTFSARPFILATLIALGVSQVAAFGPARRAAAIRIIEALKHE